MNRLTDPHTREREALEAALSALNSVVANCVVRNLLGEAKKMDATIVETRAAILAYGLAVREADKGAAEGGTGEVVKERTQDWLQAYYDGRKDPAAAIEALEERS